MKEFKLKSFDNTEIFVTLWDDVNDAKGVIQLVHGMSEYAGNYDEFAKYLNSRGYIVFGDDHRAHGRTETDENRGRHKGNIFKKTLRDEVFFRNWLKEHYDLPVFLLGHSYGSFISQAFAQESTDVKAIALLGSGYMRHLFNLAKIFLAPVWLVARNWRPRISDYMRDNLFKYKGDSGKMQWANSVKERREKMMQGQYNGATMSVNFDFCMVNETSKLYSRKALSKLNPATAIGIFSGDSDPVGEYGKGVKKLCKMYKENGVNCELHLYEGVRHEVCFDHCSQQVWQDIADFFDKFIIYEQTTIDDFVRR